MNTHEIYPNAPLRLVAFEARFPNVPPFGAAMAPDQIRRALKRNFPRAEVAAVATSVEFGPGGVRSGSEVRHRFLSEDKTTSVTLGAQTLMVETTSYKRFEQFRDVIGDAVEVVAATEEVAGLLRVGIRYIDEIRVSHPPEKLSGWGVYVDPALVAAADFLPGTAHQFLGVVDSQVADGQAIAMRFGALPTGRVVDPSGPLRVPHDDPSDQPLFFIDIDSYWTAPEHVLPGFGRDAVVELCDRLHEPTRALFEAAITDKLRDDVFRVKRSKR